MSNSEPIPSSIDPLSTDSQVDLPKSFFCSEDWLAMVIGGLFLFIALAVVGWNRPSDYESKIAERKEITKALRGLDQESPDYAEKSRELSESRKKVESQIAPNPLRTMIVKLGSWEQNPLTAFYNKKTPVFVGLLVTGLVLGLFFAIGLSWTGQSGSRFFIAFSALFGLAVFSFLLSGQKTIEHYNLEFALWALVTGLMISNTIGTPEWFKPAIRTELYIKTGLVLLGAEVLFNRLLALGVPGVFVSWLVTPVVLIATYLFGQRILKMESRSLNLVISADMSVCGVSAAIATAAACKAKKEELSLAIGLSLGFTVIMMVAMPPFIKWIGLSDTVGGAWIGGTIDSTGAVAAAGAILSDTALEVATTVKMIQNILIGVVALGVAIYWSSYVEKDAQQANAIKQSGLYEIWRRFPKFVLGFLGASILFSTIQASGTWGQLFANSAVDGTTKILRGWLFCLGFVSIGLDSNLREFMKMMSGGKPLVLYVCGQMLNLVLSLMMAWLMFEIIFKGA